MDNWQTSGTNGQRIIRWTTKGGKVMNGTQPYGLTAPEWNGSDVDETVSDTSVRWLSRARRLKIPNITKKARHLLTSADSLAPLRRSASSLAYRLFKAAANSKRLNQPMRAGRNRPWPPFPISIGRFEICRWQSAADDLLLSIIYILPRLIWLANLAGATVSFLIGQVRGGRN
ncbi:hypothetical protein QBC44DRAFT_306146 [Cladorrhinum sp. PSN332]|nr:hypothetical protein QBC44DRAFT_306146 [Cladorrhinum sp. PSN332]